MPQTEIRLWPGVPDLAALGASSFEQLMGTAPGLACEDRAAVVHRTPRHTVLRMPLPGTQDEDGRAHERPQGAGTGWVYLTRYTSGKLTERADARLSSPRSSSFASRDWNLICHLRLSGVGTPEPLAMGELVRPLFSAKSFLVTRALDSMRSLPEWLERNPEPDQRRRASLALGMALARLIASRVHLPWLEAGHLYLSSASSSQSPVEDDACAARKIAALVQEGAASPVPGTSFRQLPEVAIGSVRSGRITPSMLLGTQLEVLCSALRGLPEEHWPTTREAYRVYYHAMGRGHTRDERRNLWRQLVLRSGAIKR